MSRIALIYPKLAIFRSRRNFKQTVPATVHLIDSDVLQYPPSFNSLPNFVSHVNSFFVSLRGFSSDVADDTKISRINHPIQQDMYEQAYKALKELEESKNSSTLLIEKRAYIFCDLYRTLQPTEKKKILNDLVQVWSRQQDATLSSVKRFLTAQEKGDQALLKAEDHLRNALAVDQAWMLCSLARQEGGIKFLIEIRADILDLIASNEVANAVAFRSLSNAIKDLIGPLFGIDLLNLERVTWHSPGHLLQSISEGEAVHPIRSWSDLKKRLGPYRRCFIFSHPAVPLKPLAILHVALTNEISSNIHTIITRNLSTSVDSEVDFSVFSDKETDKDVTTAMFYSISSTCKGLAGIDLGQNLIKRALGALQEELPSLVQFSTLSPIPGFRSWLIHQFREMERGSNSVFANFSWGEAEILVKGTEEKPLSQLRQILFDSSWMKDEEKSKLLEAPLMRLCARYLFLEKRRKFAVDSVANFHLRNGATMWRLNWAADLSPRGLKNSFGMMMNYRYFLDSCEQNSQNYVAKQIIQCSEQLRHLCGVEPSPKLAHL